MDSYKLTYFSLRGIAESIRLMFKYAKVPFEEVHVDASKWKAEKKTEFKWQQLPYLEYNGKTLTQTLAIVKFLGRQFNLHPEDSWDQAKCDEIYGAIYDLRNKIEPIIEASFEGNTEVADEVRTQVLSGIFPIFLSNLHELLEKLRDNSSAETHLIFGGVAPFWVDFCLATFMEMFEKILEQPQLLAEKYPLLKKQQEAVYKLDGVKEWIAERPDTFI